ncbi:hypothetical protein CA13_09740 [Planctomycetes bacterium CA13]|uniref:Uncharacterized protein n=1 Tax=Novipirellula herctigrandis TaxID=2527986 RepID=A0A5C5YXH5_9BACT|nr:hypothetical protein CA13_09740 [Planctomycetes bacterium CA13]
MNIVRRLIGYKMQIGGVAHSGWLPDNAAVPLPTPIRNITLNLEIQHDDSGFLLCYTSTDGSVHGDTWHESLADAERMATRSFGISASEWSSC